MPQPAYKVTYDSILIKQLVQPIDVAGEAAKATFVTEEMAAGSAI